MSKAREETSVDLPLSLLDLSQVGRAPEESLSVDGVRPQVIYQLVHYRGHFAVGVL